VEDAEMLLMDDAGGMQVESEMDRTWRVGQTEIVQSAGQEAAKGRREYKLDSGPYRSRYTRNGRYVHFVLEKFKLIVFLDILL
jgi:U3 small nucleolar RNA-associated protein 7